MALSTAARSCGEPFAHAASGLPLPIGQLLAEAPSPPLAGAGSGAATVGEPGTAGVAPPPPQDAAARAAAAAIPAIHARRTDAMRTLHDRKPDAPGARGRS